MVMRLKVCYKNYKSSFTYDSEIMYTITFIYILIHFIIYFFFFLQIQSPNM